MTHERDVFINCPFDPQYRSLLRALIFAIHDCGFHARSALEVEDSGEVRVQKILRIIGESPYGIHDISRIETPRFNMPFELGLFLGAKAFGGPEQQAKNCIVLDEEPYRYQKYCSDIAGQDVRIHAGKPHVAIGLVRNWLSTTPAARALIPSGSVLVQRYRAYRQELPYWCQRLQLNPRQLTFRDHRVLVVTWLDVNPWTPVPGEDATSLTPEKSRSPHRRMQRPLRGGSPPPLRGGRSRR